MDYQYQFANAGNVVGYRRVQLFYLREAHCKNHCHVLWCWIDGLPVFCVQQFVDVCHWCGAVLYPVALGIVE